MAAREYDVIVVGGGISGLTAAYTLKKKDSNLDVLVLEAKDRVGGRTLTIDLKSKDGTDKWDLGGQWVGRCQPHIMSLLEELNIEVYPQFITGKKYMQVGKANKVTSYSSDIPTMSITGLIDLHRLLKTTDKLAAEIDPDDPFSCPKAALWDSITLENFIDSRIWSSDVKDLMRAAMRTMFGTELSQVSLLYYLTYVASAGEIKHLIEATEGTAQEFKIKDGAQQVSQCLLERLGQSNISLGEAVWSVEQSKDGVVVRTRCTDDGKCNFYNCQKLIIAIPPSQIGKIQFTPNLPVEKREISRRMPPSNVIKFVATYSESFWRDAGCSGEVVTNGGASIVNGCDTGPVGIVYDATSCNNQPALLGFIGGLQAVQWQEKNPESRRSAVLKSLSEFFGEKVYNFLDYSEKIWDQEPYNEGAPVSTVGPGAMRFYASGLRKSCDRIHFAGTESATVWCGFMNGAVQAGQRSALEVLYDLRPQLVSMADLKVQVGRRGLKKKVKSTRRRVLKVTFVLGIGILAVFAVKKFWKSD